MHGCDVSIIRVDHVVLRVIVAQSQADRHGKHKCCALAELKQVARVLLRSEC